MKKYNNFDWIKAVEVRNLDLMEKILDSESNVNINYASETGWGVFHFLSYAGDKNEEQIVKLIIKLIDKEIDVNKHDSSKISPINLSGFYMHYPKVIDVLLKNNADPFVKDLDGNRPILWALMYNQKKIVDQFVDLGLDLNEQNRINQYYAEIHSPIKKYRYNILSNLERHYEKLNKQQRKIIDKEKLRSLFYSGN